MTRRENFTDLAVEALRRADDVDTYAGVEQQPFYLAEAQVYATLAVAWADEEPS